MTTKQELYWDIEQMSIDGVSAKRIATILNCPIEVVHQVLADMGTGDNPELDDTIQADRVSY